MAKDAESLDFVIMDCGPSLGVLTLNALAAADEVFIPLQPHFLALHGLSKLLETTALVARRINPRLTVTGVVLCLYDSGTKLAQEVVSDLVRVPRPEPRRRTCRGRTPASSRRRSGGTSSWRSARASASRSSGMRRRAPARWTTRPWRTRCWQWAGRVIGPVKMNVGRADRQRGGGVNCRRAAGFTPAVFASTTRARPG